MKKGSCCEICLGTLKGERHWILRKQKDIEYEQNVCIILDFTKNAQECSMFRAYERLPDELEQLPEDVTITLIMFSQRIHFIEEDPESHRLSVVTLADEMLESSMDNIPYELSVTNRKQLFELMQGQFFEHFFNSLAVDDQNQSCMNSALYFFSNYVA